MKKIDLGQILNTLANLGVIAGIVFLALELRQNNQMMVSQTRSDISQNISDALRRMAMSEFAQDFAMPEELQRAGGIEALRFRWNLLATLRMWENIYYQWSKGLYEDSEYEAEKALWQYNMENESIRSMFCGSTTSFSAAFVSELETLITSPC